MFTKGQRNAAKSEHQVDLEKKRILIAYAVMRDDNRLSKRKLLKVQSAT